MGSSLSEQHSIKHTRVVFLEGCSFPGVLWKTDWFGGAGYSWLMCISRGELCAFSGCIPLIAPSTLLWTSPGHHLTHGHRRELPLWCSGRSEIVCSNWNLWLQSHSSKQRKKKRQKHIIAFLQDKSLIGKLDFHCANPFDILLCKTNLSLETLRGCGEQNDIPWSGCHGEMVHEFPHDYCGTEGRGPYQTITARPLATLVLNDDCCCHRKYPDNHLQLRGLNGIQKAWPQHR